MTEQTPLIGRFLLDFLRPKDAPLQGEHFLRDGK
jgi:hypothetical protein